jgi:hypothetical protein
MSDFTELLLAGILSGTVISSILGLLLYRRTAKITEEIRSEYAKRITIFESSRAWEEKSVSQLLGPMYMQFDRTQRAFDRWKANNYFLEAKVIREGNLTIQNLLLSKSDLIPPELLGDAGRLVEHYDRWLEEFERVRRSKNPDLDTPFVFVGTQGFPFPREAETKFRNAFINIWTMLYGKPASDPDKKASLPGTPPTTTL